LAEKNNYNISPGVRARKEKFGLLFYNSKNTNLTFVKSGNLLTIEQGFENTYVLKQHCNNESGKEKIIRLLKMLVKKELIVEIRRGI